MRGRTALPMPDVERELRGHHPPMINITSADGTTIAVDRTGSGPPLVVVLGAFCDRSTSKPLAALLAPAFTVLEYDRRGRGASGDGNGHPDPIEAEIEDLAAVLS